MSYQVSILPPAAKEIKGLPGYVRAQARQLIRELGENPVPGRAKELRGKPGIYRIWLAGRWRIAYRVEQGTRQVLILRVRPKAEMDYEDL